MQVLMVPLFIRVAHDLRQNHPNPQKRQNVSRVPGLSRGPRFHLGLWVRLCALHRLFEAEQRSVDGRGTNLALPAMRQGASGPQSVTVRTPSEPSQGRAPRGGWRLMAAECGTTGGRGDPHPAPRETSIQRDHAASARMPVNNGSQVELGLLSLFSTSSAK